MKKILIIDDEPNFVSLLSRRLEKRNYQTVSALLGHEGLEKVKLEKPDLIILDVRMPEVDGFAILSLLQQTPATKTIPVIMASAFGMDPDMVALAKQHGAKDFFEKTGGMTLLADKIDKFFAAPS